MIKNEKVFYMFSSMAYISNPNVKTDKLLYKDQTVKYYSEIVDFNKYIYEEVLKLKNIIDKIDKQFMEFAIDINSENKDFYLLHYVCDFNDTEDIFLESTTDIRKSSNIKPINNLNLFEYFKQEKKIRSYLLNTISKDPLYEKTLIDPDNYEVTLLKYTQDNDSGGLGFIVYISEKIDGDLVNKLREEYVASSK